MKPLKVFGLIGVLIGGLWSFESMTGPSRILLQNKGSDTMVAAVSAWSEAYKTVNPKAGVAVTAGGSGTGIAALINGTVDIANASRLMRGKEVEMARKRGHHPKKFIVGYDAVAVYLHKDNPVQTLTINQLAEIYGEDGKIERWSDIGVEVPGCKNQEIVRVSRQNSSGTYAFFRRTVLGLKRDYKLGSKDMQASRDTVALVSSAPCAIGYSSLVFASDQVKMVCIARQGDGECVNPSVNTVQDKSYPFARPLYMYTDGEPQGEIKKYIDWVLSDEGQCIIKSKGYAPIHPLTCGG
ncbi:MAG: phosphate ABC transporter substrate-binding protein [Gammaproteobacteria bacterium]|nr:phosphate ABC transporter substrate-binding protein [Gammaproteobacteria bacterium]